jgi:hypothetical protein
LFDLESGQNPGYCLIGIPILTFSIKEDIRPLQNFAPTYLLGV